MGKGINKMLEINRKRRISIIPSRRTRTKRIWMNRTASPLLQTGTPVLHRAAARQAVPVMPEEKAKGRK